MNDPLVSHEVIESATDVAALPELSLAGGRQAELTTVAPVASLFKLLIDPELVLGCLYGVARVMDVAMDHYLFLLGCFAFLLTALCLDGVFLFVPGYGGRSRSVSRFVMEWVLVVSCLGLIGSATHSVDYYPLTFLLVWSIGTPCILLLAHWLLKRLAFAEVSKEDKRVVIVGAGRLGQLLAQRLKAHPLLGIEFVGFFDDRDAERVDLNDQAKMLGNLERLAEYVRLNQVSQVFITLPMSSQPRILRILDEMQDSTASIYFVPDLFTFDLIQARFGQTAGVPIVAVRESPFVGLSGVIKRLSDIVLAAGILLLIWPVMLGIAIAVKVTSSGPVLFKQRRYGADGESILVYKFRSMTVCEDGDQIRQATRNDQRLTPIGGFIRRTSLDELPQFINVLQGRMSVVGPRPHANAHNEQYRKLIKGYMIRHKVKPGITGWAQVNGFRGETETLEKMARRIDFDLDYLRNWSLWLDLKIVYMTAMMTLRDRNAY